MISEKMQQVTILSLQSYFFSRNTELLALKFEKPKSRAKNQTQLFVNSLLQHQKTFNSDSMNDHLRGTLQENNGVPVNDHNSFSILRS